MVFWRTGGLLFCKLIARKKIYTASLTLITGGAEGLFRPFFGMPSCRIPVSVVQKSTTWILYQIRESPAQFCPSKVATMSYCPLCRDQIVVCFAFLGTFCESAFTLLECLYDVKRIHCLFCLTILFTLMSLCKCKRNVLGRNYNNSLEAVALVST